MKKLLFCFLLLICFFLFSSCNILKSIATSGKNYVKNSVDNLQQNSTSISPKNSYSINDYFPFKANIQYIYENEKNKNLSYKISSDYIKDNKIQLRVIDENNNIVKVLKNTNGELKLIHQENNCTYREDLTIKESNKDDILLKEPLSIGTTWTLPDGNKRYISNTNANISTTYGSYKTLEVTTENKNTKSKTLDYYAFNIGLIETITIDENLNKVVYSLKNITNSPLIQNIKFYYPSLEKNKLYYINKTISFNTNDITKVFFEKQLKQLPYKDLGNVLSSKVKIKTLYLNKDKKVYIDLSKDFVTEMNAGSHYESMILQSITNTIGEYYGVNKVYITVDNIPYNSGHILKNKGEVFIVNKNNCEELKNNKN